MTTPGQRPMMEATLAPRRILFFRRHGTIVCPAGHEIKDAWNFIEDDVLRCPYRYPGQGKGHSNAGECARLLYLLGGPLEVRGRHGMVKVVVGAELTPRERGELALTGKSPEEILSFLGILL